ncbi:MAG: dihydrodipicolinate synthase family protein [Clostridia bacterium]|nr:dihydrodipicolinate synthase family protein [Clostridia bacterium]
MDQQWKGVWPVMLTPFTDNGEVDYVSLGKLIDWYEINGVAGLFCLCQSSEIFCLSLQERIEIASFVKKHAHVPVIASGHVSYAISQQIDEMNRVAETGVDGLVMISNRFAPQGAPLSQWHENLQALLQQLPKHLAWGVYECPYPYKHLLSEETLQFLSKQPQMRFIKDTCCDIDIIRKRLKILEGTDLWLYNANTQTLLESLRAGSPGFSGVMANIHPELYVWLCKNYEKDPEAAEQVQAIMTVACAAELHCYPVCAKQYLVEQGIFSSNYTRVRSAHDLSVLDMEFVHRIQQLVEKKEYELSIPVNKHI